ncbi:MAG: beta-propeller fold lactonase family protein [Candidatus Goldiibacteriota bacterium]
MAEIFAGISGVFMFFSSVSVRVMRKRLFLALSLKSAFLSAAVLSGPEEYIWLLAVFAGIVFVFFSMIVYTGGNKKSGNAAKGAAAVFMLCLIFSFWGCGNEEKKVLKMPEVKSSLNLKFTPSVLLAAPGKKLYVGSERKNRVYRYNMKNGKIEDIIATGKYPYDMMLDKEVLYTANSRGANVTVYDTKSGETNNIRTRGSYPSAVALSGNKKKLYAANRGSGNVSVIDLEKKKSVKRVSTGKWPSGLYIDDEEMYLYVACKYTNTVEIIDTATDELILTKIDAGISPILILEADKNDILIISEWKYSYNQKGSVIVMDKRDFFIKKTIMTEGGASDALVSKSKKYIYLAMPLEDMIVFMDYESGKEMHRIVFEDLMPKWLALSADGKFLYATTQKDDKIHTIALNGLI